MVGRKRVVHSRPRAMLLQAAQVRMRRRKRKVKLRLGGKARAECAEAGDGKLVFPELMIQILGLLCPRDLCRARAVCKYWGELVSSPNFVRQYVESAGNRCMDAPTLAFLSYGHRQPVVGFDAELKRWVPLPAFFSHNKDTYLVAATKGLYVYNVTTQEDRSGVEWTEVEDVPEFFKKKQLVVTNPWTGATKWLPLMLNECGPQFVILDTYSDPNAFDDCGDVVFTLDVVDNGRAYILTAINPYLQRGEVYDSRLGHWSAFNARFAPAIANLSVSVGGENPSNWNCVRVMESLYFMARSTTHNDVYISVYIVSFNLESQKWGLVYGMRVKLGCQHEPWLTTCDNKLLVVDIRYTGTEISGQILTVDVERKVLSHETVLPKTLASNLVVNIAPAEHYEGRLDVVSVGMGHLLHFFSSQDKLTTYDFHTKMWRTWASSLLWPKYGSIMGQLVDVQLSLLPV